jgi:hypothetical protein
VSEPREPVAGTAPGTLDLRSEFLRGQMREWLERAVAAGRTGELFELEMWLRSFERFFRVRNQALSERDTGRLALRNWCEELRLVDEVVVRVGALITAILSEDEVNAARFGRYLESYLKRDDVVDPFVEKLLRRTTPEAALTLLREALDDVHVVLCELVQLPRVPLASFAAVGRLIVREVRRSDLLALLLDKKFKPIHDRISNPAIVEAIRKASPRERKHVALVFLELIRLVRYLEYASPERLREADRKHAVLVFSLVTAEARQLMAWLDRAVLPTLERETPLAQIYDAFVYSIPMELRKVVNTELLDLAASRQVESVKARVENSHGILRDCFQQSVVQLVQVFEPAVRGEEIFPGFSEKLEQSVRLRDGLARLVLAVRRFRKAQDAPGAEGLREEMARFYDGSMRYLMYRDWVGYEGFFIEVLKCSNLAALEPIAHRLETFLVTLLREVRKRSVLQDVPSPPELAGVE